MNGFDLLSTFRQNQSDQAFTELVRRYTNLVYSAAHRRLSNRALAQEAAQIVFIRLAKSMPELQGDASLVAWLHRTTTHVAIDVCRAETRRQRREQESVAMESSANEESSPWEEIAPHLDEALDSLSEEDRQALLLRFFAQKRMAEVGHSLGVSENAAKMRISRALHRLREHLVLRGLACTTLLLGGFLTEHAVEAAPLELVSSLRALHPNTSSSAHHASAWLSKARLGLGISVLCGVGLGLLMLYHLTAAQDTQEVSKLSTNKVKKFNLERPGRSPLKISGHAVPASPRLTLQVLDSETVAPIPYTKVMAVYFYAGGVPEGHPLNTDAEGRVAIAEPDQADDQGMNIFISAESHVPICLNWHEPQFTHRTVYLEPALTISGVVVNDNQQPVPNVTLELYPSGDNPKNPAHLAFNGGNTKSATDAQGRWRCPYVPVNYKTARVLLTADGYAVTVAEVQVGKPESTNATLIIKTGCTLLGRVTDSSHQPVADASITELHNYGYKRQETQSSRDGSFILQGLYDPLGENKITLVVQAKGLAPQARTIQLVAPTNTVTFTLSPGKRLQGQVTDEEGNPLANVTIRTDSDNQGIRKFIWHSKTDAEGRFAWNSAPEESVLMWFELPGYQVIRDLPMQAGNTDHDIVLKR